METLCDPGDGVTNSTWVICGAADDPVAVPDAKVFDPSDIDSRIFDIYVVPSKWQDATKVNLTWWAE